MLGYITLLLVCQLAGEVVVRLAHVPVPGPVAGMLILFTGLVVRGRVPEGLEGVARPLLRYLTLLFVPAGVGVVVYLPLIIEEWLPIAVAVVVGTVLTIVVTGWVMQGLGPKRKVAS